jgi:hypothetical protein
VLALLAFDVLLVPVIGGPSQPRVPVPVSRYVLTEVRTGYVKSISTKGRRTRWGNVS